MKAFLKKIKEPLTHDYVFYGLLTFGLVIIVVGLNFLYGGFGEFENQVSKGISSARSNPWLIAGGVLVITVLLTLFLRRKKNRHRRVEHT